MKRETIYVSLAGIALFVLVFYASYRYFLPEPPYDAAMKSTAAPAPAAEPVNIASPGGAPHVADQSFLPTPTADIEPVGAVLPRASSPSDAAQRSPLVQQDRDDDEAHLGMRRIPSREALSRRKVVMGKRRRRPTED